MLNRLPWLNKVYLILSHLTAANHRENACLPTHFPSIFNSAKNGYFGRFLFVNRLDFLTVDYLSFDCWLFVTAIFDNFKTGRARTKQWGSVRVLLRPCAYPNMTRKFVQFVVGSLKSGPELAVLNSGIFFCEERRVLTSTLHTGVSLLWKILQN